METKTMPKDDYMKHLAQLSERINTLAEVIKGQRKDLIEHHDLLQRVKTRMGL
jgi:ribosomal protein S15P/S13E